MELETIRTLVIVGALALFTSMIITFIMRKIHRNLVFVLPIVYAAFGIVDL